MADTHIKLYVTSIRGKMPVVYHPPTFRGKHNANRARVLLLLEYCRLGIMRLPNTGLTVKEIAVLSGCVEASLSASMNKWHRWRFLTRRLTVSPAGRKRYCYCIAVRGTRWIRKWCSYMPLLEDWKREIVENIMRQRKGSAVR